MLKIVADNAIPFVERFFSRIGQVELLDGREISAQSLANADVLVCRTLTRVDEQLLADSSLGIVASPTSGLDHIDQDYLDTRNITLCSAPGRNARSVAEYVLSALCVLSDQQGFALQSKKVGIVGCGHVGSSLRSLLGILGIECLAYDPYLKDESGSDLYCELDAVQACDIISLHVPLSREGAYPSWHMIDEAFLRGAKSDLVLVNTSRGEVIDEQALLDLARENSSLSLVLDVWANEPAINRELLQRAEIATPHIAGYSIDAKYRATRDVFQQVCQAAALSEGEAVDEVRFSDDVERSIRLSQDQDELEAISMVILSSYDVRSDAAALRRMLEDDVADANAYFAELRNNYPIRREFSSLLVEFSGPESALLEKLEQLGFHLQPGA